MEKATKVRDYVRLNSFDSFLIHSPLKILQKPGSCIFEPFVSCEDRIGFLIYNRSVVSS